jgi:hypothetical protein
MNVFGLVRPGLFVKSIKTEGFLERYVSRDKILRKTVMNLRYGTVRFAPFHRETEHDRLFGAVRLAVKNSVIYYGS